MVVQMRSAISIEATDPFNFSFLVTKIAVISKNRFIKEIWPSPQ
jgi:hypothetical protein